MSFYLTKDNDFFDDFFRFNTCKHLKTDIEEKDKFYLFTVEAPGYDKKKINVSVNNGYLKVEVNNDCETDNEKKLLHKERHCGKFSRSFYVGTQVSSDDIKANYNNGLLFIFVEKKDVNNENKLITID